MESHLMSVTSIGVPSLPCWGGAPLGLSFSVLSNTVQGTIRGGEWILYSTRWRNTFYHKVRVHIYTVYQEYQFGRPQKRPNTLSTLCTLLFSFLCTGLTGGAYYLLIRRCWFLNCSEEVLYGCGRLFKAQMALASLVAISGLTLPMPLVMDLARLKTITYRAIKTTGTLIVN